MSEDLVQDIRVQLGQLLGKPTDNLDPKALQALVQEGIEAERAARRAAHGGGSTMALNALLNFDLLIRTKVFNLPREQIRAS
ncbi:MAG TPA: hypothetical protein VFW93_01225 [Aquabacterium sp.]|uniref:hypothetical protein n=1 Tax=Aquabacterium sp. TaxID=1872578 RepID=UPI002E332246|nr:hypothetical protein [Aquabacterium sp.]HEX5354808.1 hypothetical protein [Aquabacterium sp.]